MRRVICTLLIVCLFGCSGSDAVSATRRAVRVEVAPPALTLTVGQQRRLAAIAYDAAGAAVATSIAWSSSDPGVAQLAPDGTLTARTVGHAVAIARADGGEGTVDVTVVPAGAPTLNIALTGVSLTQAVQRPDGSIPLVRGGNPVLVSVFALANEPLPSGFTPTVRVRVLSGDSVVHDDERPLSNPIAVGTSGDQPIHQVLLPSRVVGAEMRVLVQLDPRGELAEATHDDDVLPRTGTLAVPTREVPDLQLRFVPIQLSVGGTLGDVTQANVPEYLLAMRQLHPVAGIVTSVATPFTTDVDFAGGDPPAWIAILQQLDAKRVIEAGSEYYYGVITPPPGIHYVTNGGWGYIPPTSASSGPGTRTAIGVGIRWWANPRQGTETFAHELAHNFGRRHAPCGGASNPDPAYPYPDGTTGVIGYDVYSMSSGLSAAAAYRSPAMSDIMGYCTSKWISDYTYLGILNFRSAATTTVAREEAPTAPTSTLVVSGLITPTRIILNPAVAAITRPAIPSRVGEYTLRGRDASGNTIFRYTFSPNAIDHAPPGYGDFTFAVPLDSVTQARLSSIDVGGGGRRSELRSTRPVRPSPTGAPVRAQIAQRRVPNGARLSWSSRWSAAVIRDSHSGEVLAFARGSSAVLHARTSSVSVALSDGVHSEILTIRLSDR